MNKNKYILLGAVVLGLGLTSCSDFLNVDRYFRDQQSTERIFSDKDYTLQWLSFCYSRLQGGNCGTQWRMPFQFLRRPSIQRTRRPFCQIQTRRIFKFHWRPKCLEMVVWRNLSSLHSTEWIVWEWRSHSGGSDGHRGIGPFSACLFLLVTAEKIRSDTHSTTGRSRLYKIVWRTGLPT